MLRISPERRILIPLAGMIGGIALVLAGYGGRDLPLAGVLAAALGWLGRVTPMRLAGLRLYQSGPIAVITQMLGGGMPISALRAFIMGGLLIAGLLRDRLALTMRNVAL